MNAIAFIFAACWLIIFSTGTEAAESEAESWYRDQYVTLWKENAWNKRDAIAAFYDTNIQNHPFTGEVEIVDSEQWINESLEQWRTEGWLGSDAAEIRVEQLNPSTVTFKTKWRDWFADGSEAFSCSWYLADAKNNSWVFTQFAVIDCEEHGL